MTVRARPMFPVTVTTAYFTVATRNAFVVPE
jgi:hypothetical protein